MQLNRRELADKTYACFIGKNIGGTMGTPYEGKREILNVTGYSSPAGEPLPNDDLDLQLVWLRAAEVHGPFAVDANLLAEYWISYITPHWNEYGIGKANLRAGLTPPLSGEFCNPWKHSNGAWIRTEVWACMTPGNPDLAISFAHEDASIDHGEGEGTYAAMFVAAMESAAFVEKDVRRLVEIGLSKIPEDCMTAQCVKLVLSMYDSGADWKDTRNALVALTKDLGWFMAPANVGYVILGLVYGEGDFKKSMLYAVNCGDDTDCTGATIGSIMGIMGGTACIPEDWQAYIGDKIVTVSIDLGTGRHFVPKTCSELAQRVMRLAPVALRKRYSAFVPNAVTVTITDGETTVDQSELEKLSSKAIAQKYTDLNGLSVFGGNLPASVRVTYDREPQVKEGETLDLTVKIVNNTPIPNHSILHWHLPDGWTIEGNTSTYIPHRNAHNNGEAEEHYTLRIGPTAPRNRIILDIEVEGRPTPVLLALVVLG